MATPLTKLTVTRVLYRPDRLAPPNNWAEPIALDALWSDDPHDTHYNCLVRGPHGYSHERLRRSDPMYDLVFVTDWNMSPAIPGKGSAIFVHQVRREWAPTAGCIAFRRPDLMRIAKHIRPGAKCLIRYP